jgi:predicted nuclease of predicted toxin-antitoxin system
MRILADENVERPIVEYLRGEGHDVLYAAEVFASTPDPDVLSRALAEQRVVLSNDLDFGELIFHQKLGARGIVLLRLRAPSLSEKLQLFQRHWPVAEVQAIGHFVVITNRRIRVRPLA